MKNPRYAPLPVARLALSPDGHSVLLGLSMKQLSLLVLVLQNTALVLMLRYSRVTRSPDQPIYIASTAVLFVELIKMVTCLALLFIESRSVGAFLRQLHREVVQRPRELLLLAVPSALYAMQNNLLYVALSNLDATTYQVTYQLKILTTALFSVVLLRRQLSRQQWLSLAFLMVGVALVQLQSNRSASTDHEQDNDAMTAATASESDTALREEQSHRATVGFVAVLVACLSSGFAGCYFEWMLKRVETSMWIRNIQLGLSGGLFSLLLMLVQDWEPVVNGGGLLQGYDTITWSVVINQALGGLLVAVVVKYADNILKGFATSISILLSSAISYFIFDFQPSLMFLLGSATVVGSSVLYGRANKIAMSGIPSGPTSPLPRHPTQNGSADPLSASSSVRVHIRGYSSDLKHSKPPFRRGEYPPTTPT